MRGDGAQNGEEAKKIVELFQKALPGVTVETQSLKSAEVPAMILVGEQARRIKDMQRVYGGDLGISFPDDKKLVLNTTSPLVSKVCEMENEEEAQTVCQQVYDLARLANEPLSPEEMTAFISRSEKVLEMLSGK